jgi:hypothetical protein
MLVLSKRTVPLLDRHLDGARKSGVPVYDTEFSAFALEPIAGYHQRIVRRVQERVRALSDDELATEHDPRLVATLTEKMTLPPPVIDFESKAHRYLEPNAQLSTTQMRMIEYALPVSGSASLLTVEPRGVEFISGGRTPKLIAHQDQGQETITFRVPESEDTDLVVEEVKDILHNLDVNATRLAIQLEDINAGISNEIHRAITHERERRATERRRRDDLEKRLP